VAPIVPASLGDFESLVGIFHRLVVCTGLAPEQGAQIEGIALHLREAAARRKAQCLLAILQAPPQLSLGEQRLGEKLSKPSFAKDVHDVADALSGRVEISGLQIEFHEKEVASREVTVPTKAFADNAIRFGEPASAGGIP